MTTVPILDTGPLVAFLNRRDRYHGWAKARMAEMRPPLHTCEAVLSEACFLLRNLSGGTDAIMALVKRRLVTVSFQLESEHARVRRLLRRYDDRPHPMSLADACLVRMAELVDDCTVVTLDADFHIYRRNGRSIIPLTIPRS